MESVIYGSRSMSPAAPPQYSTFAPSQSVRLDEKHHILAHFQPILLVLKI